MPEQDHQTEARRVIARAQEELGFLSERIGEDFGRAVTLLRERCEAGHKVVIVGVGKSGNIGRKLAATLSSTGSPSVFLNAQDALHGDLGIVAKGDPVIALSDSGETDELLRLLPHLSRLATPIICLTGNPQATLGREAEIALSTNVEREACPLNLAPTTSATVMLVLGDALCMALLKARGFKADDFALLHPGGSLGRSLLTRVTDIMRRREQVACVLPTATVAEAVQRMGSCRCGAAAIIDESEKLLGIFTHGDFARAFESTPDLREQSVAKFMGENPITVRAEALAGEALAIFSEHRIDDLLVVDESGKVLGIIDTQDLSRHKIC